MKNHNEIKIAPSLICTDLCNIQSSVSSLEALNVDLLHIDILDGHFSPSLPLGIETVKQLRKITALPFDVHLMVDSNEFFIKEMLDIGVQQMCFHIESAFHTDRLLGMIKNSNVRAGIALMPATPVTVLDYALESCDFILLMLINPGFAGHASEKQVPYALKKVQDCFNYIRKKGFDIPISVDGRVSMESIAGLVEVGADILVAGSQSLFRKNFQLDENYKNMKEAILSGLGRRMCI